MTKNPNIFDSISETYTVDVEAGNRGILGEGGSGRVYAVLDNTKKQWALKCLKPESVNKEKRKRFTNELVFCSTDIHKNILSVVDSGFVFIEKKKCPFYVMPFYNKTLRTLMDEGISIKNILPLFNQIINGVEAAHKKGVWHRDLKPENVLYDLEKNNVVIADFGIAHFNEDIIVTLVATKNSAKMANIRYSAPEQRSKGEDVDQRADIFALGLILNEMFTEEVPQGTGYKKINDIDPSYAYLDNLVERMLRQDRENRPFSINDIKKELIGRKIEFVAQQKLDRVRNKVVPTAEPGKAQIVEIVGFDYDKGILSLTLNCTPEPGWISKFHSPDGAYSSHPQINPTSFIFIKNKTTISLRPQSAQKAVEQFKRYSEMATQGYQAFLNTKAAEEEAERRHNLEKEIEMEETRARVLTNLKI